MLTSLSSNTGRNSVNQVECAKLNDVYKCINDLEERINDNCGCNQCLQEQIDCINDNPVIIKDEGQFDNLYTDCLNVTNPIVTPGVDNDFTVSGDLTANDINANNVNVCYDLKVDGCTTLNGPIELNCVTQASVDDLNVTTVDASTITASSLCSDNIDAENIDARSIGAVGANIATADINTATICDASINNLNVATINTPSATICGATICCGNITEADLNIFKNSRQIGNKFVSMPIDALGDTADFYRYQIFPGFSGEVNLWNCDFSINILTNNSNNVLVGYRADDPSKIKGFYKDNCNNRFYIELCSTENLCWSYRSAQQHCCYDFSCNSLIEACTTAGAYYTDDCTYVCVAAHNYKDHWYLMGDNTAMSGLGVCGSLAATYLEFQCSYFPGGLVLDCLTVNGHTELFGCVEIGKENQPADVRQYGDFCTNNLHVYCSSILGDHFTAEDIYEMSTYWDAATEYFTYDAVTEEYTSVGLLPEEDWVPNTYYWLHHYPQSVNTLSGSTQVCGCICQTCGCYLNDNVLITGNSVCVYNCVDPTDPSVCYCTCVDGCSVHTHHYYGDFVDICDFNACCLNVSCCTNLCNSTSINGTNTICGVNTISGETYFDGGSDNCPIIIDTDVAAVCSLDVGGCLCVGCDLSVSGCTNINQLAVNCCATFACDVSIDGDLFVDGTMHIVDEETINVNGDIITLRTNNPTALSGDKVSGLFINKYNGVDDLTVAADCTGTLRVGTASGTTTSYADICYNSSANEWTSNGVVVSPVGELTSWDCKVECNPFTAYTNAIFTQIDITTMEPVATRAEAASMNDNALGVWNSTCERFETINAPANDGEILCACIDGGNISYCWMTQGGAAAILPAGVIVPYAGASAPTGWMLAQGQCLCVDDEPLLFAAIGYTWGCIADGCFRVPDLREALPRGVGNSSYNFCAHGGGPGLGCFQNDAVECHTHNVYVRDLGHVHCYSGIISITAPSFTGNVGYGMGSGFLNTESSAANIQVKPYGDWTGNDYSTSCNAIGRSSNVTRDKSVGVNYIISLGHI